MAAVHGAELWGPQVRVPCTPAHAWGQVGGLSDVLVNLHELTPLATPRALVNVVGGCR